MPDVDLVYIDLIEEEPLTEGGFAQHTGVTVDELRDGEYQRYLDRFQPWRTIIRSGGNQKTMFRSSERYHNRADAISAAKKISEASTTVMLRENEHGNVVLRQGAVKA